LLFSKKVNPFAIKQIQPLFAKHRGGGTSTLLPRASLPPSHAPRGAPIPCALTRLRILPVTTGVYVPPMPFRSGPPPIWRLASLPSHSFLRC
jgi:hypothetical protein